MTKFYDSCYFISFIKNEIHFENTQYAIVIEEIETIFVFIDVFEVFNWSRVVCDTYAFQRKVIFREKARTCISYLQVRLCNSVGCFLRGSLPERYVVKAVEWPGNWNHGGWCIPGRAIAIQRWWWTKLSPQKSRLFPVVLILGKRHQVENIKSKIFILCTWQVTLDWNWFSFTSRKLQKQGNLVWKCFHN